MANIFLQVFQNYQIVFLILLRETTLESNVSPTNRNSSAFLLHTNKIFYNIELFSICSQTFWELIFATKITTIQYIHTYYTNTISCFVYQLSKEYCVYYLSEHFKYCSQINEYWLNKNACLNIVLLILLFKMKELDLASPYRRPLW